MESILEVLQGSYAYLLIIQILIVTALFFALIALIVRRMMKFSDPSLEELPKFDTENTVNLNVVSIDQFSAQLQNNSDNLPPSDESSVKSADTAPAAQKLSEPPKHQDSGEPQNDLIEKVKYLEGKLLEYEILQEELSTLSALKAENEELKQRLIYNKASVTVENQTNHTDTVTHVAFSKPETSNNNIDSEVVNDLGAPQADNSKNFESASLESLLQQIDELIKPEEDQSSIKSANSHS